MPEAWETQLASYRTDPNAAIQELLRAKRVAEARSGQGLDISAQNRWANQVRAAAGLGSEYGAGVTSGQAQNSYNMYNTNNQMQGLLSQLQNNKFNYTASDAARSPEYRAAKQLMNRQVKADNQNTMEALNDRGILNSSVTADRVASNQQSASDKLAALIPGIVQNQLSQYNAEQGQQYNVLNALMGMYNSAQNQANSDRTFGLQEAGLTGLFNGSPTLEAQKWSATPESQPWYLDQTQRLGEANIANLLRSANAPYGGGGGGGSGGGGSSSGGGTLTERTNNSLADAYSAVDAAISNGASLADIEASINSQTSDLTRQNIDPQKLVEYLYSRYPQQAAPAEEPNPLDQRPFWQRAIDTVIPGAQYR